MEEDELRIAGFVDDSIVDGPGIRFTLFVQGCLHDCPGCQNPQTHDPTGGYTKTVKEIWQLIQENPLLDGITFSGGEPMEQPVPLKRLADLAHEAELNVWCYTGYTYEELEAGEPSPAAKALMECCDVLVDGPFEEAKRSYLHFRGSTNQRLIDVATSLERGHASLFERAM